MAFDLLTWRELTFAFAPRYLPSNFADIIVSNCTPALLRLLQIFKRSPRRHSPPTSSTRGPPPDCVPRPSTPPAPQVLEPVVPYTGPDHFTFLPTEILLEIASFACADSQSAYRALLLVSRRLNLVVKFDCLHFVPVRLQCNSHIEKFRLLLMLYPDLIPRVRHLWINTPPRMTATNAGLTWEDGPSSPAVRVARLCTNIVTLSCSTPVLHYVNFGSSPNILIPRSLSSECGWGSVQDSTFKHTKLRELTLLNNFFNWSFFFDDDRGTVNSTVSHLFTQLTHLTLLEPIGQDFPVKKFTSLQYFSAEIYPPCSTSNTLDTGVAVTNSRIHVLLAPLPEDVRITLIIYHTKINRKEEIEMSDSGRFFTVRVGKPTYFQWWADRARGGDGLWS
jgi:hypothetical protein